MKSRRGAPLDGPKLMGWSIVGFILVGLWIHPHEMDNSARLAFVFVGFQPLVFFCQLRSFVRGEYRWLECFDMFVWWLVTALSLPLGYFGLREIAKVIWQLLTGDDGTSLPPLSR